MSDIHQQKTKTILIVEDDKNVADFLVQALNKETPYHIQWAADSSQALTITQTVIPDLLLLNYQLPHMNGIELYDCLRTQEGLSRVPAIVMSANVPPGEVRKRSLYHIGKPFDLDKILQIIEDIMDDHTYPDGLDQ